MLPQGPVGVFDSGVGGLSILFEIQRLLPAEDLVYLADTLNCPYGPRSADDIRRLSSQAAERLLDEGAKVIVVACNSASTVALEHLRERYPVPFIGTVPAVKPAALVSRTGRIALLGTRATVGTEAVQRLIQEHAADRVVFRRAVPDRLVELIEARQLDGAETHALLSDVLKPLLQEGVDTVVLGCTHYAFVRPAVQKIVGPNVRVLDTGLPVARQVRRVLDHWGLTQERDEVGRVRYLATARPADLAATAETLMRVFVSQVADP